MGILVAVIGLQAILLAVVLVAAAADRHARADAWRRIAEARRCANCPTCRRRPVP